MRATPRVRVYIKRLTLASITQVGAPGQVLRDLRCRTRLTTENDDYSPFWKCCLYCDESAANPPWVMGGTEMHKALAIHPKIFMQQWRSQRMKQKKFLIMIANYCVFRLHENSSK
jgi:hypothetical protein